MPDYIEIKFLTGFQFEIRLPSKRSLSSVKPMIKSNLYEGLMEDHSEPSDMLKRRMRASCHAVETLVLNQAAAGIDTSTAAYREALNSTICAICERYGTEA